MIRLLPSLLLLALLPAPAVAQDMMFRSNGGMGGATDMPIWVGAARCAAFGDTVEDEIQIRRRVLAESRRRWPNNADSYREDPEWEARVRERVEHDRTYWRRFAMARLRIDRPGENHEALFDARMAQELQDIRRTSLNEEGRRFFKQACFDFLLEAGGSVSRVERGVADKILKAASEAHMAQPDHAAQPAEPARSERRAR